MREVLPGWNCDIACPVITVGGTNGKGSTCAMLESILRAAGYRIGLYTLAAPPALQRARAHRRRARRRTRRLREAFAAVEAARGEMPLTYFEFGTLAALWLFRRRRPRRRGPRGRPGRPARRGERLRRRLRGADQRRHRPRRTTSGDTREAIGREKAGIFRAGQAGGRRRPEPPALGAGSAPVDASCCCSAAISATSRRGRNGPTGARPASARAWRTRRCAAPSSCAMRAPRLPRSSAARAAADRDAGCAPRPRRGRACPGASRCCRAGRR